MSYVFGKEKERNVLDAILSGKNRLNHEFKKTINIIFEVVAKINHDEYDNSLQNLYRNVEYTYSDDVDIVSIPIGDIIRLKKLLVEKYVEKSNIFLTSENSYNESLRTILAY